jgi:hypothetical protein
MIFLDISDHTAYDYFVRKVVLDEKDFHFKFRYNSRYDFWTLEIQDENKSPIKIYKCVCNFDLLYRDKYITDLPNGKLFLYSEEKAASYAKKMDFQNKVVNMYYIPNTELASL